MRRLMALCAAAALMLSLAGSALAAPRSMFNGDFDVLADNGALIFHVTAKLWSTDFSAPAGTFVTRAADGTVGSNAQVGETAFYHSPESGVDEVWFKAVEIGYPTDGTLPSYSLFVGHFVDMLDPAEADYVEFWGQPLVGEPVPWSGVSLGGQYYFRFDVGVGAFALHVAG